MKIKTRLKLFETEEFIWDYLHSFNDSFNNIVKTISFWALTFPGFGNNFVPMANIIW